MARAEEYFAALQMAQGCTITLPMTLPCSTSSCASTVRSKGNFAPMACCIRPVLKPARQIRDPPFPRRCWKFVHNEEPDGRPAHDHRAELETNLRSVGTVGYAKAVLPDDLREQVCIPGDVHLHDPVNPAPSGDLLDAVRHCFSFVVDDLVGSGCLCVRRLLVRTHRSDDLCSPKQLRELDCVVPNRPSASRDEDRLTLR